MFFFYIYFDVLSELKNTSQKKLFGNPYDKNNWQFSRETLLNPCMDVFKYMILLSK